MDRTVSSYFDCTEDLIARENTRPAEQFSRSIGTFLTLAESAYAAFSKTQITSALDWEQNADRCPVAISKHILVLFSVYVLFYK